MKNRILVPVSNPLGGIRTYMLYNFTPLQKMGFRFTFLAPEGQAFESFKENLTDWEGVEFIDVPVNKRKFALWRHVNLALKSRRFSLVHSQGLRAGTETAIGNFFINVPHLITLHDVIVPQNDIPGKFKWLKKFISGYFTRHATAIIPVSNDCAENHLEHFPCWKKGPCKIEVISNGIDVAKLLESRKDYEGANSQTVRQKYGFDKNIVLGGFFGRFMPQKGFIFVREALSELVKRGYKDRFRLVVTTDQHGYRNETLNSISQSTELSEMVRFVESVSDIAPLMSQMDVLVMPSLWEACPILPMEALVLGVPVIGSDALGLREVLKDTPALTPPKENATALADAIESFIKNPDELKNAAKKFEPIAQKKFDVKLAVEKLQFLYQSVIK
ncbi:MAG: glycosyltransferase family 4 protein [Thermoguttaceae bacterium]